MVPVSVNYLLAKAVFEPKRAAYRCEPSNLLGRLVRQVGPVPTGRLQWLVSGGRKKSALLANRLFDVIESGNLITISARPIIRIYAHPNPTVETRPFPIHRTPNVPVFHRIEVDVIKMALEVVFLFDRVFPKLGLPDSTPPVGLSSLRDFTFRTTRRKPPLCELRFDPLPSAGVIRIAPRHAPDRMEMIRQQHDCADFKRMRLLTFPNHVAEDRARMRRLKE